MKLVIQRVISAQVINKETGRLVGKIGKGFFVLLGIAEDDTEKLVVNSAEKLVKLRIMPDKIGKMNLSIKDSTKEVLVVSQFTLLADTAKGNRPSFVKAAEPKKARGLYNLFIEKLKNSGLTVESGSFGAYMQINAVMDGPVTIVI